MSERRRLGMSDTDPEVERMLVEANRRRTPEERLAMVWQLNATGQRMALAGIRQRHGYALSPREEQLRLAQEEHLDQSYFRRTCRDLGVDDLLDELLEG